MSAHPTRRKNRTRTPRLARPAIAFGIDLAENPNAGKRGASPMSWQTRTLANLDAIARFENLRERDAAYPSLAPERVTFRGVASNGRKDQRVGETRFGRV